MTTTIVIALLVAFSIISVMGIILLIAREVVQKEEYDRELKQKEVFIEYQHNLIKIKEHDAEFMKLAAQSIHEIVTKSVFYDKRTDNLITFQDLDYVGDL